MNKEQLLQQQISNLERELLELKTAHRVSSLLRAFTFVPEGQAVEIRPTYQVNYADGDTPIITEFIYGMAGQSVPIVAETPSGNTQRFQALYYSGQYLTIISTREILSVEKVG